MDSGVIFRFANTLAAEVPQGDSTDFACTEAHWSRFLDFCSQRSLTSVTETEKQWENLVATAREEGFFALDSTAFLRLAPLVKVDVLRDLALHKNDIIALLESETNARLKGFQGWMEWNVPQDKELQEALRWLNGGEMEAKLRGPGKPRGKK
jgi:carboxyl-terminal processing protease